MSFQPIVNIDDDVSRHEGLGSRASSRLRPLGIPVSRYATFESVDNESLLRPLEAINEQLPLPQVHPLPDVGQHTTPLPILPMVVLSIVSVLSLRYIRGTLNRWIGPSRRVSNCECLPSVSTVYGGRYAFRPLPLNVCDEACQVSRTLRMSRKKRSAFTLDF